MAEWPISHNAKTPLYGKLMSHFDTMQADLNTQKELTCKPWVLR